MRIETRGRGQGKVEYVVLVVLVALASLAAVKFFGRTIERKAVGSQIEVEFMDR
ncbi:MAG: hypothetical protein HY720_27560 [Planctomycetes bacterium]|nr:hypothetical protein [Planctomycetota bacterium]